MRRRTFAALATVTARGIAAFGPPGQAQGAYPERPITLVVAAPAGVGTVLKDWTPAEMDKFARDEGGTWSKLSRDSNITMAE